jgi:hypothetical protein
MTLKWFQLSLSLSFNTAHALYFYCKVFIA